MIDINDYIEKRRLALRQLPTTTSSIAWSNTLNNSTDIFNKSSKEFILPNNNKASKTWATTIKASTKLLGLVKRTRRPAAWRLFSEVSVAGVSAALDKRSPPLRRILWTVVLIVCAALMFAQCLDRVLRYMEEPINVNVRITHNDSLEYPAVTVCNKNIFNRTHALHLMRINKLVPPSINETNLNISLLIGVNGITPSKLWDLLTQKRDIFVAECWFGRGTRCEEQGQWIPVNTVMGPCYTYLLNETHVSTVGSFHNLFFLMHETTPALKDEVGVRILVHERRTSPILAARTLSMSAELGWSREVKLELRKFRILNTDKQPCKDDVNYSEQECQLQCFQQIMLDMNKCKMPYMTGPLFTNISECATPDDYEEAMNAINSMVFLGGWSSGDCKCPHECYQTGYQMYPENMAYKPNAMKIRIFYDNLVFEQITEERAYSLISLLCDIGGTLGLLMGASVLTVCEILEVAWSHFIQRCCYLEDRTPKELPTTISKINNTHQNLRLKQTSLLPM